MKAELRIRNKPGKNSTGDDTMPAGVPMTVDGEKEFRAQNLRQIEAITFRQQALLRDASAPIGPNRDNP
jgi:hypothetical protein